MRGEFLQDFGFLAVKLHILAVKGGDFLFTLGVKLHKFTA